MPAQHRRQSLNVDDARENEGGRFAIAGLIYQAIGVAGLLAEARLELEPDDIGGILSVTHEKHGQDAVVEGNEPTGRRFQELIQFKFSLGGIRPIQPKELFDIVDGFANSEQAASQLGSATCGCRLVTNRPLSPGAEREIAAAKSDAATRYLNGNDDRRRILACLEFEQKTLAELKGTVEEYGRRRGMFPTELNDGVQRLVGWLQENTGALGALRVTHEDLDERLTGSWDVRDILATHFERPCWRSCVNFGRMRDCPIGSSAAPSRMKSNVRFKKSRS